MTCNSLHVFVGRLKQVQFVWREGVNPSSTPLNLTGATCVIRNHNLSAAPAISIVTPASGLCELSFNPDCTEGLTPGSRPFWIEIALTYAASPGYSPDPVRVEVSVLS